MCTHYTIFLIRNGVCACCHRAGVPCSSRALAGSGGEAGWRVTTERPGGAHQQDGDIHRAGLGDEQKSATAAQTTKNTN